MAFRGAPTQPPDNQDLSADVLNRIPGEGTTLPRLIDEMKADPDSVEAALQRLHEKGLIEMINGVIRTTAFVQKARGLFKFVS